MTYDDDEDPQWQFSKPTSPLVHLQRCRIPFVSWRL